MIVGDSGTPPQSPDEEAQETHVATNMASSSTRMTNRPDRTDTTPVQKAAMIVSILFLLIGIAGFLLATRAGSELFG